MKVLNLYAGIGGNRKLWPDYCEVTAVEIDPEIAEVYKAFFPKDRVIVADAHDFLLNHFQEYDFIWSSPPCPTHSRVNAGFGAHGNGKYFYTDMTLYQEIVLLKSFFKGIWVVENVIPYYTPLIPPSCVRDRHYFWSNFFIPSDGVGVAFSDQPIRYIKVGTNRFGFDLKPFNISEKRKLLRNLVRPKVGLYIFNCAFKEKQATLQ